LEFADIITTHNMNPSGEYQGTTYQYGWNVGGWPASSMRFYLNNTNDSTSIINSLPEVLRNAIIDTTVVSGHGSTVGETNFTSTDKLYLLSTHEVWEDGDGIANGGINYFDTAYDSTRQLDYYAGLNVTTFSNYSVTIKQLNGSNASWWLRSAFFNDNTASAFYSPYDDGICITTSACFARGVSPAFRLG
jgi:hypothetical protein